MLLVVQGNINRIIDLLLPVLVKSGEWEAGNGKEDKKEFSQKD